MHTRSESHEELPDAGELAAALATTPPAAAAAAATAASSSLASRTGTLQGIAWALSRAAHAQRLGLRAHKALGES